MLSVICPIYNEEKYIRACIESILAQDYPKDDLEVIFADGMSSDGTREIVAEYSSKYPWIHLIDNPDRIVPPALNKAIEASTGDIIIRLDAHAEYPEDYFSKLVRGLKEYEADNIGGVCLTLPINNTAKAKAIAHVLSSKFGMGNSDFRTGLSKPKETDTVPFGCWRREVFDKIGYFDNELIRNQDDEFNGRLRKHGGRIILLPDVKIKYYARDTIRKVWRMFYQYGLFKPLVNSKLKAPATVRQFFPPTLVIGLIFGLIICLAWHPFIWVYLIGIGLYLMLDIFFSFQKKASISEQLYRAIIYPCVHIAYGIGYITGSWRIITRKSFNAKVNR